MPRSTILFGNGLGMALDATYFNLSTALSHAWGIIDGVALSDDDKRRIVRCVKSEDITFAPTSETQLDTLQQVISACDFLNEIGDSLVHWLSEDAKPFPTAVRSYFGRAASYFHYYPGVLPIEYVDSLEAFIRRTNSHVATLNYDDLLYRPFIERGLCSGYDGYLVDGFYRSGFNRDNLIRKWSSTFGYYMHLHGCPLFVEITPGKIEKIPMSSLSDSHHLRKHLILTHHKFKETLIQNSYVLRTYLEFLYNALGESVNLICFGYSGADTHINHIIKTWKEIHSPNIYIVEWNGSGTYSERIDFWTSVFGTTVGVTLIHLDNILSFRFETIA